MKFLKACQFASTVLLVAFMTTGCAVNRATAHVDTHTNLASLKKMHVMQAHGETRNTDVLIVEKLRSKGYDVTTGDKPASNVDALVTYVDKWMWDITMYMLELTVTIRDPKTSYPLASGNSFHTSLTRLSPEEMVNEVIENIIKEGNSK